MGSNRGWGRKGAHASGPGSVVITGDNYGSVSTQVFTGAAPSTHRIDYQRASSGLVEYYTSAFVGRVAQLEAVERFLANPEQGYFLCTAPAGYGKSAFTAELVRRHSVGALRSPRALDLIYFFIREQGQRNTVAAFCAGVNSLLLDLLGETAGVPDNIEGARYQFTALWSAAAQRNDRLLLLVVDGLDEQAVEAVQIIDLLPQEMPPTVKIIVTSRPYSPFQEKLDTAHPLRRASTQVLPPLSTSEIRELLADNEARSDTTSLSHRIREITGGEPLFVRFVCEDATVHGALALSEIELKRPSGVRDYFINQLRQLISRARESDEDIARDSLGVLLAVHSPVTTAEIAGILGTRLWKLNRAIEPLRRFLIGDNQVELMHVELRRALEREFSVDDIAHYSEKIVQWCARYAAEEWPPTTPAYVRLNYGMHLAKSQHGARLFELIAPAWFHLHARHSSMDIFARDALLAIDFAAHAEPPNLMEEMRCSVLYAHARSAPTIWDPAVYRALTMLRGPSDAESYASLLVNPNAKAKALAAIAAECGPGSRSLSFLETAAELTASIRSPLERTETLMKLAHIAGETGHDSLMRNLVADAGPTYRRCAGKKV